MINERSLTDMLNRIRIEHNIAGMSVAVTDENGILYNQGFGFENAMRPDVPTHLDAMYKIASMTKTMVAILILRLCEKGILNLDEPIKTYLPELKLTRPDAERCITLRHLLTHVAGMPGDVFLEEGSRDEDTMNDVILSTVRDFEIPHLPEEKHYCYSTWGYNLIGCVASKVMSRPISELLSEYVLTPLGMDRTTFDYFVASTYPLSLPHATSKDGKHSVIHYQRINTAHHAGGGLYSNTADMCKLSRFFLRGGVSDSGERLLSETVFRDLTAKHIARETPAGSFYGLGVAVYPFGCGFGVGHTGNYHPYNSSFFAIKEKNLAVVTMFNSDVGDVRYKIPEMIFSMVE